MKWISETISTYVSRHGRADAMRVEVTW